MESLLPQNSSAYHPSSSVWRNTALKGLRSLVIWLNWIMWGHIGSHRVIQSRYLCLRLCWSYSDSDLTWQLDKCFIKQIQLESHWGRKITPSQKVKGKKTESRGCSTQTMTISWFFSATPLASYWNDSFTQYVVLFFQSQHLCGNSGASVCVRAGLLKNDLRGISFHATLCMLCCTLIWVKDKKDLMNRWTQGYLRLY